MGRGIDEIRNRTAKSCLNERLQVFLSFLWFSVSFSLDTYHHPSFLRHKVAPLGKAGIHIEPIARTIFPKQ